MESKDKKRISKESFRRSLRIFQYVLPYRGKFLLGLLFLFLSSVTFMTFPGLLGRLIGGNEASDSPIDRFFNVDNIDQVALLLLVAFLLQAVFSFMRIFLFADVTERAIAQLRIDTYGHLIKLPMTFFNRERVGELNSRISNDISHASRYVHDDPGGAFPTGHCDFGRGFPAVLLQRRTDPCYAYLSFRS